MVDGSRALVEGGLGPGSSSAALKRTLELAGYAHGFALDIPFEKLPARTQNLLLHGYPSNGNHAPNEDEHKKGKNEKGFRFQGILKFLQRNFEESGSDSYREWMTRYMSA